MSHADDMKKLLVEALPKYNETPIRMGDLYIKLGCEPSGGSVVGRLFGHIVQEMEKSGDVRWSNDDKNVPCIQLSARWAANQKQKQKENK